MTTKKPRGIRNNNPGNIKRSSTLWQGMAIEQDDDVFITFKTPEYGIRAMVRLLITYKIKYGIKTIKSIITRYAPNSENNTAAYIRAVAKQTGLDPDAEIDIGDFETAFPLIKAIIKHENGYQPYSDGQIIRGLALAGIKSNSSRMVITTQKKIDKVVDKNVKALAFGGTGGVIAVVKEFSDLNSMIADMSFVAMMICAGACLLYIAYNNKEFIKGWLDDKLA